MTQSVSSYPQLPDEDSRLAELDSYQILDTPEEQVFSRITELAGRVFEVPIALVSLVAKDRQWFKAKVGLTASETSRDVSFCAHAIESDELLVVPSAVDDPRFKNNSLVTGAPGIRFYAGSPLVTPNGHRLGTLCVIDTIARPELLPEEQCTLDDFAALVMDRLNLRRAEIAQNKLEVALVNRNRELDAALLKEKELTGLQSQFISMVNHEFRTPLSVIDGNAQRVLRRCESVSSDQLKKGMEKTRSSIFRLTGLIESLLDAARVESGGIKFQPEECSPAREISELADTYRKQNSCDRINVDVERLPDCFRMDVGLMRQVFSNLISNALTYTGEATQVWIQGKESVEGGIEVTVRDEGPGIPKAEVGRLFERFYRASTSTGIAGTGIGLFMAETLVGLHGGKIDVLSDESKGSEFTVFLPMLGAASS